MNAVVIRADECKEHLEYKIVGKRECEKLDWDFVPNNNGNFFYYGRPKPLIRNSDLRDLRVRKKIEYR